MSSSFAHSAWFIPSSAYHGVKGEANGLEARAGSSLRAFMACFPASPYGPRRFIMGEMTAHPDNEITYFAETNFRGKRRRFGIRLPDRRAHMYVIGKTGTGKSTLLETLIRQDMENGHGLALLDPHGDLVSKLLSAIPDHRKADVIHFDVADSSRPLGFNPLESVDREKRPLAAIGLLDAFKKIWVDSWGPRLEHILRNALLALLEYPGATLGDVLRLLSDDAFRRDVAGRLSNAPVRQFWLREYEGYPPKFRAEAIAPIQNKVGAFLANPTLNRILSQPRSAFDCRRVMDEGKILLVNLSKGKIGEDTASLLGALLVSKFSLAALSRADVAEEERRDFFLYLDEFHSVSTGALATMLSELRKYRVGLILAHQYLEQVEEEVLAAILGNVGTQIVFRLGISDAEVFAKEFYPEIGLEDLVSLPNRHVYLRLMIDGRAARPFSGQLTPCLHRPHPLEHN